MSSHLTLSILLVAVYFISAFFWIHCTSVFTVFFCSHFIIVTMTSELPGPSGLPLIGNILDIQDEVPLHALERMVDVYGPVYRLKLPGGEKAFCGGFKIFDELCDETKFFKVAPKNLQSLGRRPNKGLFTAPTEKHEDWGVAHRVLMPAFGPLAIQDMFGGMPKF
jgi:cytochrome P450 / NADPH-cytochrome P450 reductase